MKPGIAVETRPPQDPIVAEGEEAGTPHADRDVADVAGRTTETKTEIAETMAPADNVVPIARAAERFATAEEEAEVERLREKFGGAP